MNAAFEVVAFAVCAFIAVAGALGMTTTMSMFRSGIFLMASFLGVAGLFIVLAADLLGLLQVMMYIGGMLVMILFMVLFMHDPGGAMMAGMEGMALPERWFSAGLVPLKDGAESKDGMDMASHDQGQHDAGESAGHGSTAGSEDGATHHHDGGSDEGSGMDMSMVTPMRQPAAWLALGVGVLLIGLMLLRPAWPVRIAQPDPVSARQIGNLLMDKYMIAFEGAGTLILIGIFGAVLLARPTTYPDDPARGARVGIDKKPEPVASDSLDHSPPDAPDRPHAGHRP